MTDPEITTRLRDVLVARAGGYLRNPPRRSQVTCAVCAAPAAGYTRCFICQGHRAQAGLADRTAFLTFAVAGQQSAYVMRGYKAQPPVGEHVTTVTLLALLALVMHRDCPGAMASQPVTHWATVPSLPARPGEHPLHRIIGNVAPGNEIRLTAAAQCRAPRDVSPAHFSAGAPLPPGSHVLLIDDTWTTGGHAQSAVLALRRAAATQVSVLVVARWINKDYRGNAAFLTELAGRDYDPAVCPWTGGACPLPPPAG